MMTVWHGRTLRDDALAAGTAAPALAGKGERREALANLRL
jgi:hypothetical protein